MSSWKLSPTRKTYSITLGGKIFPGLIVLKMMVSSSKKKCTVNWEQMRKDFSLEGHLTCQKLTICNRSANTLYLWAGGLILTEGVKVFPFPIVNAKGIWWCTLYNLLNPTDNKYDYLPTTVNICSEVVKLFLCVVLALWVKKKGEYICFK